MYGVPDNCRNSRVFPVTQRGFKVEEENQQTPRSRVASEHFFATQKDYRKFTSSWSRLG